jgi:hypothetical protein
MPRNIPEQRRSHLHRAGSLKPHILLRSSHQLFKHTAMKEWEPSEKKRYENLPGYINHGSPDKQNPSH